MGKSQEIEDSGEKWNSFLKKVLIETDKLLLGGAGIPYYRGHYHTTWKLKPSIFRKNLSYSDIFRLESILACDFHSLCGQLYDRGLTDWEMSFEMRHAGLPTRLLDWTEDFSNALYFALYGKPISEIIEERKPCIWILDPYKLNEKAYRKQIIPETGSLDFPYHMAEERDWNKLRKKYDGPIAIIPPRSYRRIIAQKSVFTLHSNNIPIEKYYASCVKKIDIPIECISQAESFLFLAGVNDYSLFPDLDGLGKYLLKRHLRDH